MVNVVSMEDSNKSTILHHDQFRYYTVQNLHDLSQPFMDLTILFANKNLPFTCILFCDRALESMIKALYLKENHSIFPPHSLSVDDLFKLISHESSPELDSVLLVDSIRYLVRLQDSSLITQMKIEHLKKITKRVDELLCRLSPRVTIHPSESYHSIF